LSLVLVLPDLKKQQAQFDKLREQNRMLRERLDKERMVADQRHMETAGRLRAHDRVLGVDTAPAAESPQRIGAGAPPPPAPEAGHLASRQWYYAIDSQERGPLEIDALRSLWLAGKLRPDTLVWAKGMEQWTQVQAVPGLSEVLRG
jgi:hypothetical protein